MERDDGRVVAMEVKLSPSVGEADVKHLRWLREQLGDHLLDSVVITTGRARLPSCRRDRGRSGRAARRVRPGVSLTSLT